MNASRRTEKPAPVTAIATKPEAATRWIVPNAPKDFDALVGDLKKVLSYGRGAWSQLAALAERCGTAPVWVEALTAAEGAEGTGFASYCSRLRTALELGVNLRITEGEKAGTLQSYGALGAQINQAKMAALAAGKQLANKGGRPQGSTNTTKPAALPMSVVDDKGNTKIVKAKADGSEQTVPVAQACLEHYKAGIAGCVHLATPAELFEFCKMDALSMTSRFNAFRIELIQQQAEKDQLEIRAAA